MARTNAYELAPDDEVEIVMDAFRIMFDKDRVHSLFTKMIRKGPTSDLIYVPKGLHGKLVTVIVWGNKEDLLISKPVLKPAEELIIVKKELEELKAKSEAGETNGA